MLNYTVLVNTLILVKKTINQLKKNKKKKTIKQFKKKSKPNKTKKKQIFFKSQRTKLN